MKGVKCYMFYYLLPSHDDQAHPVHHNPENVSLLWREGKGVVTLCHLLAVASLICSKPVEPHSVTLESGVLCRTRVFSNVPLLPLPVK